MSEVKDISHDQESGWMHMEEPQPGSTARVRGRMGTDDTLD